MSLWVAVGTLNSTSNILYSTNGKSWTDASGAKFSSEGLGVAYNGTDKWVAVGTGVATILISPDGMNWSANRKVGNALKSIAYGGDKWVAVGENGKYANLFWSSDGIGWNLSTGAFFKPVSPTSGFGSGNRVAYGNGTWIAVGRDRGGGTNILRSTNGTFWENTVGSFNNIGYGVAYGKDGSGAPLWVAVGRMNNNVDNILWSDDDGQNWVVASGPFDSGNVRGVAYGNNKWVAVGEMTSRMVWSYDGKMWEAVSVPYFVGGGGYSVTYNNGWVAVGSNTTGSNMIRSINGLSWYDMSGSYFGSGGCNDVFGVQQSPPAPCFVKGTRVLTPTGYTQIEELQSGDCVITANKRIVKIKLYSFTIEETTTDTAPYRIPADVLGKNIPKNDIHLSPRHAIKDSNGHWQIPKYLGNNAIQYGVGKPVTYYHIECPNYYTDNLIVEGAEVESYKNKQGAPGVIYIWDPTICGWERLPPNKMTTIPKNPTTHMIYSY